MHELEGTPDLRAGQGTKPARRGPGFVVRDARREVRTQRLDELKGSGQRLVMASGTGALPDTGDGAFTEETTFDPPDFEARTEAEREVLATPGRGVRGTLIRPSLVLGRSGGVFLTAMIAAACRAGHATIPDAGRPGFNDRGLAYHEKRVPSKKRALNATRNAI